VVDDSFEALQAALPERYTIEREIARTGMSHVYLAREHHPDRHVAIKVLNQDLTAHLGRERFLREVDLTSSLVHPHIVPIFAAGDADGALYYVMPYISGETLGDRMEREGRLPIQESVRVALEVASALQYAHGKNVIHRDIKPGNVLLQEGHALVADFGIARVLSLADRGSLTQVGHTIGTPDYMSPEQAGAQEHLDGRSDMYSLACILFAMLVGEPPFPSSSVQATLARHLTEAPRSIRGQRKSVDPEIDGVIQRALQKAPEERFVSVEEFRGALADAHAMASLKESITRSDTISGARPPWYKVPRWARQAIAGMLVVASAGIAWSTWARSGVGATSGETGAAYEATEFAAFWLDRRTATGVRQAIESYREAITLDPDYAPAHAGLSLAYALAVIYRYEIGVGAFEATGRALWYADRAVELDGLLASAYAARGLILMMALAELSDAEADFNTATELQANDASTLSWLARVRARQGNDAGALDAAAQAVRIDPTHSGRRVAYARHAFRAGLYETAIVQAREALKLEPELMLMRAFEARALLLSGASEECLGLPLGPHAVIRAMCLRDQGRLIEAEAIVDSVATLVRANDGADTVFTHVTRVEDLASYYARIGDVRETNTWLLAAYTRSPTGIDVFVLESALFSPVRDAPAFFVNVLATRGTIWGRVQAERSPVDLAGNP
jgi:tetratricopeptide (TPR) repeat protein